MLEQLEARAIVWTVAGVYFAATLVLSVITCVIMRMRSKQIYKCNEPDVGVVPEVTLTPAAPPSPGKLKSPYKSVNRSDSTKPLVPKMRLCSEGDSGDSPDGNAANNSGTTSPQENPMVPISPCNQKSPHKVNRSESTKPLVKRDLLGSESSEGDHAVEGNAANNSGTTSPQENPMVPISPCNQKSPHKVNRSESTKPLVKRDPLGSESSVGDHAVEGRPTEHHEMVGRNGGEGQVLDEVFEENETVAGDDKTRQTDPSGISEERIDKKIEEMVEEGKRRRKSNPRKESATALTGTSVSESSV